MNTEDVTVTIRSSGERTVPVLKFLLEKQLSEQQVFVVNEVPLSLAMKNCYQIGIREDRKYLLILDGDILPFRNMLEQMTAIFNRLDERVFGLQCKILDKMTNSFRYAGIHMHRTNLLKVATDLIPIEQKVMRPESVTINRMKSQGNPTLFIDHVLALHDYEQYYCDLFRKGYLFSHKSTKAIPYLKTFWRKHMDGDYTILLEGLHRGERYNKLVLPDKDYFRQFNIDKVLTKHGLEEKKELNSTSISFEKIQDIYNEFSVPGEYYDFKLFGNGKSDKVSAKRRLHQLKGKLGILRLGFWLIGNYIEKVGKTIREKMES